MKTLNVQKNILNYLLKNRKKIDKIKFYSLLRSISSLHEWLKHIHFDERMNIIYLSKYSVCDIGIDLTIGDKFTEKISICKKFKFKNYELKINFIPSKEKEARSLINSIRKELILI